MISCRPWVAVTLAAALAACSPTLNWRDVRPEGSGAALLMPCRPDEQRRDVTLAGASVKLSMSACRAGAQTWALAHADVVDEARVSAALTELRVAAAANLGASAPQALALNVPGATPNPASQRLRLAGHLPDGTAVEEDVAVFARGTRVFQATVIGPSLSAEGVQTFFTSLRVGR
ncbi:MAG: hypothetical protein ABT20_04820 [Rubrivivax sp. SCN 70-15]|nr:MAG: hypothetical protein ABT20_04820 [Rubrivivax sp. SCN 70-15]